jgi:hypothetical protein
MAADESTAQDLDAPEAIGRPIGNRSDLGAG